MCAAWPLTRRLSRASDMNTANRGSGAGRSDASRGRAARWRRAVLVAILLVAYAAADIFWPLKRDASRFDPVAMITPAHLDTLLDAARKAPSAGNSQPWMFIAGLRGDSVHSRLVPHLARSSAVWAPSASLLVANLAQIHLEDTPDWEYSEFSRYDLGQAVAHMSIQGLSLGLDAH